MNDSNQHWMQPKLAAQMLGGDTHDLLTLAKLGLVDRKLTGGGHSRYCADDLVKLINYRQERAVMALAKE